MDEACAGRVAKGESLPVVRRVMPFVELPLNATEDRLVGTLSVEDALRTGERKFEPGLLAAANRGILYVDEVNLLDDHLVDMLLDAAASGVNVVEREAISYVHPSRFILVGTMNPEEGDLRPQFLDRFGLCVDVIGVAEIEQRMEVVRRRIAFDQAPDAFLQRWAEQEETLAGKVSVARERLADCTVTDQVLEGAVRLAEGAGARGHRAEIVLFRTARALAAWHGREQADWRDLEQAARLVLPHRVPDARLSSAETLQKRISEVLAQAGAVCAEPDADELSDAESMQVPGSMAAGSIILTPEKKSPSC
jgi:Mg-chelatase subunit ChlI